MSRYTGQAPDSERAKDWRSDAECRYEDPDLFFPVGTAGRLALSQIDEAKDVCRRCPVQPSCLAYALDNGPEDGVWGGMTVDEMRPLRQQLSRLAATAGTTGKQPACGTAEACKLHRPRQAIGPAGRLANVETEAEAELETDGAAES